MIKTLRITIIVTAIVAVVFFVLSAVFGLRHDKDKEAFLATPSATAVFKKGTGNRNTAEADAPLVTQASEFADRLKPKPPPEAVSAGPPIPVVEIPKFRLLGTSFYPDDASRSMALIDEPGKGMHWVVQGDKVGHLTITQIADGKITYTDGKKSTEMMVEKPQTVPQISVLSVNDASPSSAVGNLSTEPTVAVPVPPQIPEVQNPQPPSPPSATDEVKENVEFVKKVMADQNSLGAAEANELKDLGEFLAQIEQEQAKAQAEANQPQAEPNSEKAEPNDSSKVDEPQK